MAGSPLDSLLAELAAAANPVRAASSVWFFKTGKGEYGEGDQFLGVTVPAQRKIALRYRDLPEKALKKLLASKIHEQRFVALEILVAQFEAATPAQKTVLPWQYRAGQQLGSGRYLRALHCGRVFADPPARYFAQTGQVS